MIELDEQLAKIMEYYPNSEIVTPTQISIPLFPKARVILNFKNYPKKPKIELPKMLKKSLSDISIYIPPYRNWNKTEPLDFVSLLTAIQQTVETLAGQLVHLSDQSIQDISYLARSASPQEMFCTLRLKNGCLQDFLLSPGLATTNRSAVFTPNRIGRDISLVASCHSHPSGNPIPSQADLRTFSKFRINMIIGSPFTINSLRAYNSRGDPVPVKIHTFDPFWD